MELRSRFAPLRGGSGLTSDQAYVKVVSFLRSEGISTSGWEGMEAQLSLLGEVIGDCPRAAGTGSIPLLALFKGRR